MSAGPAIRVAYLVSPSEHFAGIERVVHEVATGLALAHPETFDIHVVYGNDLRAEALSSTAYTKHVLGVGRLLDVARPLRRLVGELRPDVLVVPQVEASVVAWVAARGTETVVVPHLHGNPSVERAEGTVRSRVAFSLFEQVVSRRVPVVLAVSPSLREHAATTIARHARTVYVPNPVRDLGAVDRPARADAAPFRFVCVARLARQKGQDLLLRALAEARSALPELELVLVGRGETEGELRSLSTQLGLDDVVTFAGQSPDPTDHLRRADCFVLASRWEGFGVALVEALQVGLPLIATDCDFGPGDVVTGPELGILVPPDDVSALARALVEMAGRPASPADEEARRDSARQYRPEAVIAAHASVIRSVAPPPPGEPAP